MVVDIMSDGKAATMGARCTYFPGGPGLSDKWLEQLKEGGFNTVWAKTVVELDLALPKGGGFLLRLTR